MKLNGRRWASARGGGGDGRGLARCSDGRGWKMVSLNELRKELIL